MNQRHKHNNHDRPLDDTLQINHLNGRPAAPENQNPPVSHYYYPEDNPPTDFEPPRRRLWLKAIGLALLFIILFGGGYLLWTLFRVTGNPLDFFSPLKGEADGRVNVMLLGTGDPGHPGENLADTNMVVSFNTRTNQVAMISIPRDTRVNIPGYGRAKINQAHAEGGVETSREVISDMLGIPIHYYIRANFTGLREVVDAVGGIEITNRDNLYDPEYPCDTNPSRSCGYRLRPGTYKMDGADALKYTRCRKGTCGDDFGRARRQQEVLQAVRQKALSVSTLTNPVTVDRLVSSVGNNIKTDLSVKNLLTLSDKSKNTNGDPISVVFNTEPFGLLTNARGSSDLVPVGGSFDDIQAFVRDIWTAGPIWSEQSNIIILNGTTTPGLAVKLESLIEDSGQPINILSLGNARLRKYPTSEIIDHSRGQSPHTVKYLEQQLGVTATQPERATNPGYDIEVIVGDDYAAKQAPASSR